MQLRSRTILGRAVGGTAIAAAAALAVPALASAEPVALSAPTVATATEANTLSVTVANPNDDPMSSCGAFALDAAKLPALLEDPNKATEEGFLAWQTDVAERVGPGAEATFTTDLGSGLYAVVGECISLADPTAPAVGEPRIVPVGLSTGSLDLGSVQDVIGDLLGDVLAGLTTGSASQPDA